MIRPCLLIVLLCSTLSAQDTLTAGERPPQWFTAGMGGSSHGLTMGGAFSSDVQGFLLSVRYTYGEEFKLLGGGKPRETVWDAAILVGEKWHNTWGLFSLSAGLSLVGGVQRGAWLSSSGWFSSQFEEKTFSHAGLPLEAQWIWRPLDDFGVGLYAFGNVNRTKPFYGALLSFQFGRFTDAPRTPVASTP